MKTTASLVALIAVFLFGIIYPSVSMGQDLLLQQAPHFTVLADRSFVFNPRTHRWAAMDDGRIIKSGRASGGRSYCTDIHRACHTPVGVFRIHQKGGPECRSSRYPVGEGGAPMPYCMFFSQYYAVHGSYEVPNYNASHGCIRVSPSDARWLSHHFMSIGTKVIVKPY